MTDNVYWILALKINDGKLDEFKALADEMCASTKKEPGALAYEWHLSDDGSTCHIFERYADPKAVMAHMATFAGFAEQFMSLVTPVSATIYGKVDDQVRQAAADMGPVYLTQFAGFAR